MQMSISILTTKGMNLLNPQQYKSSPDIPSCDNGNIGPPDGVGPGTATQVMPMIQYSSCTGDSLAFSTKKKSSGRNRCNFN